MLLHSALCTPPFGTLTKFVCGGETSTGTYTGTGGRYNFAAGTWTQLPIGPGSPGARAAHTAVNNGGKMYIWGGLGTGGVALNPGSIYDPVANTWMAMNTTGAPAARQSHHAIATFNGAATTYPEDARACDYSNNDWIHSFAYPAPVGRQAPSAVWSGHETFGFGGQNASGSLNDLSGSGRPSVTSISTPIPNFRCIL